MGVICISLLGQEAWGVHCQEVYLLKIKGCTNRGPSESLQRVPVDPNTATTGCRTALCIYLHLLIPH